MKVTLSHSHQKQIICSTAPKIKTIFLMNHTNLLDMLFNNLFYMTLRPLCTVLYSIFGLFYSYGFAQCLSMVSEEFFNA